jgi:hypothetical protein
MPSIQGFDVAEGYNSLAAYRKMLRREATEILKAAGAPNVDAEQVGEKVMSLAQDSVINYGQALATTTTGSTGGCSTYRAWARTQIP